MKFIYITLLLIIFSSCNKNLDGLGFPALKVDNYDFGNHEEEIEIPSIYDIDEDMIHLFPLTSTDKITGDTYKIYAVYIGDMATISTDTVILYTHGQAKNMDYYWSRASLLANLSSKNHYGVLMMDYRWYGMSEGTPTEIGLSEDVTACIEWLKSKNVQAKNTIYYAFSLGVIPSLDLIGNKTDFIPTKILIESPLSSVENLTNNSTLINVDPRFMTSLKFNNVNAIQKVKIPLYWLHGREDSYIELSNGQLVYDNHTGAYKEPHIIDGAEHADIPVVMGFETYLKSVNDFIIK